LDSSRYDKNDVIRRIAALLLLETQRHHYVSRSKVESIARKYNISFESIKEELVKRFHSVGIVLREVEVERRNKRKRMLICVLDPELDLDASFIDPIMAAVLAIIYVRTKRGEILIDELYDEISKLFGSEEIKAKISEILRVLEKKKLISIDTKERIIRLKPLAIAMMPPKDKIDKLLLDVLTRREG